MTTFRVHFSDGKKIDVDASDAKTAAAIAGKSQAGPIIKIKVVRS